jgi:uncharacterized membrane protein (DUF4010 family)
MARGVAATASPAIAATAIAVGVLTNTAMKLGLAVFFGAPRFRAIAGGALALMLVAMGGALLFLLQWGLVAPSTIRAAGLKRTEGRGDVRE